MKLDPLLFNVDPICLHCIIKIKDEMGSILLRNARPKSLHDDTHITITHFHFFSFYVLELNFITFVHEKKHVMCFRILITSYFCWFTKKKKLSCIFLERPLRNWFIIDILCMCIPIRSLTFLVENSLLVGSAFLILYQNFYFNQSTSQNIKRIFVSLRSQWKRKAETSKISKKNNNIFKRSNSHVNIEYRRRRKLNFSIRTSDAQYTWNTKDQTRIICKTIVTP